MTKEVAEERAQEEEEFQAMICLEREDHEFLTFLCAAGRHSLGPAGEEGLLKLPSMD